MRSVGQIFGNVWTGVSLRDRQAETGTRDNPLLYRATLWPRAQRASLARCLAPATRFHPILQGRPVEVTRGADEYRRSNGFLSPMPFRPIYDYGGDGILRSHEASLHRLGLAHVDLLLCTISGEGRAATIRGVSQMEAVAARHDVPLAAAALQFPLGHPAISHVVAGFRDPHQVGQSVGWIDHPIPVDFGAQLRDKSLLRPDPPSSSIGSH
jgi:hypothetical protein